MGKPIAQLAGQKFGRLTAKTITGTSKHGRALWLCSCDCGESTLVNARALVTGNTKSCGCLNAELSAARLPHGTGSESGKFRHGEAGRTHSAEYVAWSGAKNRCQNTKSPAYPNYGGRGITMCDRWLGLNGYLNFLADMGRRPTPNHSLDRFPNNDGNYEPMNCRWATDAEQVNNRRIRKVENFSDEIIRQEFIKRGLSL